MIISGVKRGKKGGLIAFTPQGKIVLGIEKVAGELLPFLEEEAKSPRYCKNTFLLLSFIEKEKYIIAKDIVAVPDLCDGIQIGSSYTIGEDDETDLYIPVELRRERTGKSEEFLAVLSEDEKSIRFIYEDGTEVSLSDREREFLLGRSISVYKRENGERVEGFSESWKVFNAALHLLLDRKYRSEEEQRKREQWRAKRLKRIEEIRRNYDGPEWHFMQD